MKHTPFPSTLSDISAAGARKHIEDSREKSGKTRNGPLGPRSYIARDTAVFAFPDGRKHPAYDVHAPECPEGAEPGLGDVSYDLKAYPNDTHGYEHRILSFRSTSDLEANGMAIDYTAAGIVFGPSGACLVVTENEEEMALVAANLDPDETLGRGTIRRHGLEPGEEMQVFVATKAVSGVEILGAARPEDLHEALKVRYSFLNDRVPDDSYEAFVATLVDHAGRHGWIAVESTREDAIAKALEIVPQADEPDDDPSP